MELDNLRNFTSHVLVDEEDINQSALSEDPLLLRDRLKKHHSVLLFYKIQRRNSDV